MLRLKDNRATVWSMLHRRGPMTLAALADSTGLTQARLRTHLRAHRDAYGSFPTYVDGVKLRLWHVRGPIE